MMEIVERTETGRTQTTVFAENEITRRLDAWKVNDRLHLIQVFARVFLPAGFPDAVSPDYLRYQIYNALQAFCSSLAGLLTSRATLEGFGVGDATASSTDALLLSVIQDICSRLTTIIGGYYIGTSLYPEAKTYRLLADILNDAAMALEVFSPVLNSISINLPFSVSFSLPASASRMFVLCLSGSLRALCTVTAGGSKAALTMHFATPLKGNGDLGELNAKDASKETVLALSGMLLGTLIIPHVTTPSATYTLLFILLAMHLLLNYIGIRGVALRSINRQRAGILWSTYRASSQSEVLSPQRVSEYERIFERPQILRDASTGVIIGCCSMGSPLSSSLKGALDRNLLKMFDGERYILLVERSLPQMPVRLHIVLKDSHTPVDQLKSWFHAVEVGRSKRAKGGSGDIRNAYTEVQKHFNTFLEQLKETGWDVNSGTLVPGTPTVLVEVREVDIGKKNI